MRNSPGTGEFPAQMASNAENVSIWWRHHELTAILDAVLGLNIGHRWTQFTRRILFYELIPAVQIINIDLM